MKQHPVFSYIFIGFGAFAVEYACFAGLLHFGSPLLLAQTLSFIAGLMISFFGNRRLTFSNRGEYALSRTSQLWRYAALASFNLILSNLLILLLVDSLGVVAFVAKVVVMAAIVMWNYFLFNKVIFKTQTN